MGLGAPAEEARAALSQEQAMRYYTVVLINLQAKTLSGIPSPHSLRDSLGGARHEQAAEIGGSHNQAIPEFNQVLCRSELPTPSAMLSRRSLASLTPSGRCAGAGHEARRRLDGCLRGGDELC